MVVSTMRCVCGIVGIFSKSQATSEQLGAHMARMLVAMSERGPDSTGIAVYGESLPPDSCRVSLRQESAELDWSAVERRLAVALDSARTARIGEGYASFVVGVEGTQAQQWIEANMPEVRVMSAGRAIEIFKDAQAPSAFVSRFQLQGMRGSHALGHTRMATESRVTPDGSHPFSTGLDVCLVHNGSLSNHNGLRRELRDQGITFRTENDSEVAAGYLTWRLREGASIDQALEDCINDLDGFYTFAVGTADGFAVLRDPIACKPAVMAETDEWVAMASEYRALALLPGAKEAEVWEPEPARVYSWGRAVVA